MKICATKLGEAGGNLLLMTLKIGYAKLEYTIRSLFDMFIKKTSYTTALDQAGRVRTIAEYFIKNIASLDFIYTIEKIKLFLC